MKISVFIILLVCSGWGYGADLRLNHLQYLGTALTHLTKSTQCS